MSTTVYLVVFCFNSPTYDYHYILLLQKRSAPEKYRAIDVALEVARSLIRHHDNLTKVCDDECPKNDLLKLYELNLLRRKDIDCRLNNFNKLRNSTSIAKQY